MSHPSATNRVIKVELDRVLSQYLQSRRWYGDKSESISRLEWNSLGQIQIDQVELHMGIVSVEFAGETTAEYSLPIVVDSFNRASDPIATVQAANGEAFIYDALAHEAFFGWLTKVLTGQAQDDHLNLGTTWFPTIESSNFTETELLSSARASSAEQSNSSVIFGEKLIVKFFRRLRPGLNPDGEVGRFLTSVAHFGNVPITYGEIRVSLRGNREASWAVAQAYIESVADGWEFSRRKLASMAASRSLDEESLVAWLSEARALGETTAELHLALVGNFGSADFAPEPVSIDDIASWTDDLDAKLRTVLDRLNRPQISERIDPGLTSAVVQASPRLLATANNLSLVVECSKTRIHGDFHLGQTLRTADGRWVILDFEGEPGKSIEERRAKSSPLRDVAGMLRSFNYARGITAREIGQESSASLAKWEKETREAFLGGYFERARPGSARFLPNTQEDARLVLNAWELQKALYEVLYELDNRPNWAWLPLTAILKLA